MSEARGAIPKKIDRYEIIEAVGYGAMGAVYKAFDPLIKRPVAVKTLRLDVPPGSPDYKAFLSRFQTEARTAGRLSHPNIVTLYDVAPAGDEIPWLAMEYVEGSTAAELLEGERLPAEVVVGLVSQIASAIDYAHSEGVIHRDIKPSNIIVYGGEKVKVTDFGIAKLMDAEVTQSGLMMGTPSYMSPEQAMGEDLDGRTDIFSLGVVAFEMLSGRQPFPGNNVTSILYKLVHSEPVHPENLEVLGLLPDKWREVFARVLAKDPLERFPTAADFVKQLEHCLGSWFGALEGETVIMREPLGSGKAFPKAPPREDADDADETVLAPAAALGKEDPEVGSSDETVLAPPPRERVDFADGATATLERTSALSGETTPAAAPIRDETGPAVPTSEGSERTLYADDDLDETVRGLDETLRAANDAGKGRSERLGFATVRRARFERKHAALAAGVVALVAVVAAVVATRGNREPQPVPVATPVPPPPVVVESGTLAVESEPAGARVIVNGEEKGVTPLELEELPFGVYELRVERSGFRTEKLEAELTEGAPRKTLELTLRPAPVAAKPAFLTIRSTPDGASVRIDGKEIGTTPVERQRVRAGNRTLEIERDGFLPWEDKVRARAGRTVDIDAVLTARRAEAPAELQPAPPKVPQVPKGTTVNRGEPGVVSAKCLRCPAVRFPEAARRGKLEGVVQLSFIIDENGAVRDIQVEESGGRVFDDAVTEAVRKWRYEPATLHDVPVRMRWVQRFRFRQGR